MADAVTHWDVWGRIDGRTVHMLYTGTLDEIQHVLRVENSRRDVEGLGLIKGRPASRTMIRKRIPWSVASLNLHFRDNTYHKAMIKWTEDYEKDAPP